MPVVRSSQTKVTSKENMFDMTSKNIKISAAASRKVEETSSDSKIKVVMVNLALQSKEQVYFPISKTERSLYRTSDGKKLTAHKWAVYDLTCQIPCGKVTTYKHLCTKLGEGSPRSIGSALRNNPFAPLVPCHRVIASDLSLGGFQGEWGTQNEQGSSCSRKVEMLKQEGVKFGKDGKLVDVGKVVWK